MQHSDISSFNTLFHFHTYYIGLCLSNEIYNSNTWKMRVLTGGVPWPAGPGVYPSVAGSGIVGVS